VKNAGGTSEDVVLFDHERLDVYRLAVEHLVHAARIARRIPPHDGFLRQQLLRASTSICFNLAEGSGELSAGDKVRFYRMARRSASEAAAIYDALAALGIIENARTREPKQQLSRICAMLTRLIQSRSGRQP
jgi:four helix bundle protein